MIATLSPVQNFGEFLKARAAAAGYAKFAELAKAMGRAPATLYRLFGWDKPPEPGASHETTKHSLAVALGFKEWGDVVKAWKSGSVMAGLEGSGTHGRNGKGRKAGPDELSDMPASVRPNDFRDARPAQVMDRLLASRPGDRPNTGDPHRARPVPFNGRRVFVSRIEGDCMEPVWQDGDEVVFQMIDSGIDKIEEGHGYYVQFDGSRNSENTFKRVYIDGENPEVFILKCFNPRFKDKKWPVRSSEIVGMAKALYKLDTPDQDRP